MNLVAQAQHPTQIDSWEVVLMSIVEKISLTTAEYEKALSFPVAFNLALYLYLPSLLYRTKM